MGGVTPFYGTMGGAISTFVSTMGGALSDTMGGVKTSVTPERSVHQLIDACFFYLFIRIRRNYRFRWPQKVREYLFIGLLKKIIFKYDSSTYN
jgi:nitrate/nitrite transporter NarK